MRIPRPSAALVISVVALLLAAGGGAFAAVTVTGSAVNIVDPTVSTRIAHVDSNGKLQVGGTLNVQAASPANFIRRAASVSATDGCVTVATPPTSKAMIVKEVMVNVYDNPTPGATEDVALWLGSCATIVATINPATLGPTIVPIEPGLAIPAAGRLSATADGSVQAQVYAFGYAVNASAVP